MLAHERTLTNKIREGRAESKCTTKSKPKIRMYSRTYMNARSQKIQIQKNKNKKTNKSQNNQTHSTRTIVVQIQQQNLVLKCNNKYNNAKIQSETRQQEIQQQYRVLQRQPKQNIVHTHAPSKTSLVINQKKRLLINLSWQKQAKVSE